MFSENDINNIDDEWDSFCDDEKAQREEDNTGFCYRNNHFVKGGRHNKEFTVTSVSASLAPAPASLVCPASPAKRTEKSLIVSIIS